MANVKIKDDERSMCKRKLSLVFLSFCTASQLFLKLKLFKNVFSQNKLHVYLWFLMRSLPTDSFDLHIGLFFARKARNQFDSNGTEENLK